MHAIDYLCRLSKMNLKEFAEILNIKHTQQISIWKSGKRPIPEKYLTKLCNLFNVPESRSELFKKTSIDERDIHELEIYNYDRMIQDYQPNDDEQINQQVLDTLRYRRSNAQRAYQIIDKLYDLKFILNSALLSGMKEEVFQDQLVKIDKLIDDIKKIRNNSDNYYYYPINL